MAQNPKPSPVVVGKDGFAYADGVRLGRFIPESKSIQFLDRDRRRCVEKGREVVEVKLADLANLQDKK
jgi:hypothetical protein